VGEAHYDFYRLKVYVQDGTKNLQEKKKKETELKKQNYTCNCNQALKVSACFFFIL
jgi:hypothetical protein